MSQYKIEWAEHKQIKEMWDDDQIVKEWDGGVEYKSFTGTLDECREVLNNLDKVLLAKDPVFTEGDFSEFVPAIPYPDSNV